MDTPLLQIKPNVKKAMTTKAIMVVVFLLLILGMGFYLNTLVGIGVFLEVFSELGIEISGRSVLLTFGCLVAVVAALMVTASYVNYHDVAYTIYPDKLLYTPPASSLLNKNPIEYPFANINAITFKKQGALKPNVIQVALSGEKRTTINIPYIDDPEQVIAELHRIIEGWRVRYYTEAAHEYRRQNIMG